MKTVNTIKTDMTPEKGPNAVCWYYSRFGRGIIKVVLPHLLAQKQETYEQQVH